ncbi:hypothetical protein BHE74_00015750, partial [Ensete ventricosum]
RQEARVPVVVSDIASGGDTNYSPEIRLEDKNPQNLEEKKPSYSEIRSKLEGRKYSGQKAIPRLESINGSTHGAGSARSSTGSRLRSTLFHLNLLVSPSLTIRYTGQPFHPKASAFILTRNFNEYLFDLSSFNWSLSNVPVTSSHDTWCNDMTPVESPL